MINQKQTLISAIIGIALVGSGGLTPIIIESYADPRGAFWPVHIECKVGVICYDTEGADEIFGTNYADTIYALGGNDVVHALQVHSIS